MAADQLDPIREARRQWIAHGWEAAAPGMAAVTTVVRLNQLLMARIERLLRPYDLTFARFEVLRLLAFTSSGCLPMGRLGALLQVHPASVTNAVDRLEAQGLIERRPHPSDGRSTLAVLLPAGRERVEAATVVLNELFAQVSAHDGVDGLTDALGALAALGDVDG